MRLRDIILLLLHFDNRSPVSFFHLKHMILLAQKMGVTIPEHIQER